MGLNKVAQAPRLRYTGWKSQKVFMKCYFQNLDALKFHAVAAGKVVNPIPSESELSD